MCILCIVIVVLFTNKELYKTLLLLLQPPSRPIQMGASFECVDSKIRVKEITEEKSQKGNSDATLKHFLDKIRQSQPATPSQPSPKGLLEALDIPSQV